MCGAWIALELARGGRDVVLLDAGRPGDGATGRNAGFLLAESDCFGLAVAQHGEPAARALRAAGVRTRALVEALVDGRPRMIDLRWCGSVRLAEDEGERRAFEQSADAGLDGVALRPVARVPERGGRDAYVVALADAGDGVLHPLKLLACVLDAARRAGARVHPHTPVHAIDAVAGGSLVTTGHGAVRAAEVTLATSAAARRMLPAARPIRPVRAQALVARVTPAPRWRRAVYATRGGDYWRPLPGGRVLLGGLRRLRRRHENTARTAPSPELQRSLDGLLRELVGADTRIEVTHRWAGTMAFTPDGLPWAGRLPRRPRISILAGMNGHGMGWAPALAEQLVAHLVDGAPPPPAFLRPRP